MRVDQRNTATCDQIRWLLSEASAIVNGKIWRWYSCWFSEAFLIIARYRINRFFYLLTGRGWSCIRVLISPLSFLVRPWFGHQQIHYEADVGIGMNILHPGLGLQISKRAIVGKNLLMAGGNAIGLRAQGSDARPVVGDNVEMGLGAIILGPVRIGNNVVIGAGAVVVDDVEDGKIVAGVPAREIS